MRGQSPIQIDFFLQHDASHADSIIAMYTDTAESRGRDDQQLLMLIECRPRAVSERAWYDHSATVLHDRASEAFAGARDQTPELVLEAVTDALNESIAELFAKRGDAFDNLTLLVALTEHGQVHFTQIGRVRALLMHGVSAADIAEKQESSSLIKAFMHVTSGLLNPGDSLLFITDSLADYIAKDKLRILADTYPPRLLVAELTELLKGAAKHTSFGAIVIKFTTDLDELAKEKNHAAAVYEETSDETDDDGPLRPYGFIAEQANEEAAPRSYRFNQGRTTTRISDLAQSLRLGDVLRYALKASVWYVQYVWHVIRTIVTTLKIVLRILVSPRARAHEERTILGIITTALANFTQSFKQSTLRTRRVIILLAGALILLTHTLVWQSLQQAQTRAYAAFDDLLTTVSSQQREAENAAIYNDEARAEDILQAALTLLEQFPSRDEDQDAQIQRYADDIDRQLQEIRHITVIEQPLVVADGTQQLTGTPQRILYDNGTYVVSGGMQLFRVDEHAFRSLGSADDSIVDLLRIDNAIVAITASGGLYRVTVDGVEKLAFTKAATNTAVTSAAAYGGNIYILDAAAGALFRYTGSGLRFGNGTIWLRDQEALGDGLNITVDGAIYVASAGGGVRKFLRGAPQSFSLEQTTPRVSGPTFITTTEKGQSLYRADPTNGRLVVYAKDGALRQQFLSRDFENVGGVASDAQEETLYAVSGGTIYAVKLEKN